MLYLIMHVVSSEKEEQELGFIVSTTYEAKINNFSTWEKKLCSSP